MLKSWVTAAAVLGMAGLLWAAGGRPGVVRTRDGGVYDGMVDERDDGVVVNVRGIDTTIARDNIVSITYGEFEQRWTEAYAKLDPKDVPGRVQAARRAFDQKRYDLAEKALRDAQAIDPNNAEAADLMRLTLNQRKLESGQSPPADPAAPAAAPATPVQSAGQWKTLSPEQINRVKQSEIRENDNKLRVNFANGVLKKFYDATPTLARDYPTYNNFRSAPPVVQAARIIHDGTAEMAKDVKITSDPDSIVAFRRDAMPLVLQGCATSLCHGGNNAASAKFSLISPAPDNAAVYTNFYVLQTTTSKNTGESKQMADGSTAKPPETAYMLDHMRPDMSLVLQQGLADQFAEIKHPKVRGYTGIYPRGRDDPKYKAVLAFVSSLNSVQPDYGFDFQLGRKDAAGPSTQP